MIQWCLLKALWVVYLHPSDCIPLSTSPPPPTGSPLSSPRSPWLLFSSHLYLHPLLLYHPLSSFCLSLSPPLYLLPCLLSLPPTCSLLSSSLFLSTSTPPPLSPTPPLSLPFCHSLPLLDLLPPLPFCLSLGVLAPSILSLAPSVFISPRPALPTVSLLCFSFPPSVSMAPSILLSSSVSLPPSPLCFHRSLSPPLPVSWSWLSLDSMVLYLALPPSPPHAPSST